MKGAGLEAAFPYWPEQFRLKQRLIETVANSRGKPQIVGLEIPETVRHRPGERLCVRCNKRLAGMTVLLEPPLFRVGRPAYTDLSCAGWWENTYLRLRTAGFGSIFQPARLL